MFLSDLLIGGYIYGEILPMNENFFYKKNDNKDGFHNFCIECMKS